MWKESLDVLLRNETIQQKMQDIIVRGRYLLASNRYCIRASAVVVTVMPSVGQLTCNATELVLL